MQVILDSPFARPGSAPIGAGRKESSGTGLLWLILIKKNYVIKGNLSIKIVN